MGIDSGSGVKIFLSHISEEAEVAHFIQQTLEEDFDVLNFFTSSSIGSILTGRTWLDAIQSGMEKAQIVIVLCSKSSVKRPWVQFELGSAWMRKLPIIPICHSGMKPTDLPLPLSLLEGIELGSERALPKLYDSLATILGLNKTPKPGNLAERRQRIAELEQRFREGQVQQFERYIDIVLPAPGMLDGDLIPDDALVESDAMSLELFGYFPGERRWRDIVVAARRTPDTRWLKQLQRCVRLASNNEVFQPVQAIFHTERGSYQPQLARRETHPDGGARFHVHFVDTVVAPLSEVQNDFGLLATLLRLGLRFRYEVIERYPKLQRAAGPNGQRASADEVLQHLRTAVEVIENDALSRGAENIDRDAVIALFDDARDQDEMADVQAGWDSARMRLFANDPPPDATASAEIVRAMRGINFRFMALGTRRFHEFVNTRWRTGDSAAPDVRPAA
jgi:hypothetical protein